VSGHLLVVDDEPSLRQLIAELLEDEGYSVETAANGAEALAKVLDDLPRLVLLDLMMPIMDGRTFLQKIQERGLRSRLPILVLSANRMSAQEIEHLRVDEFCPKPCPFDTLLDKVAKLSGGPPGVIGSGKAAASRRTRL
jgi:two-component system chemotaxis response regulator CheY